MWIRGHGKPRSCTCLSYLPRGKGALLFSTCSPFSTVEHRCLFRLNTIVYVSPLLDYNKMMCWLSMQWCNASKRANTRCASSTRGASCKCSCTKNIVAYAPSLSPLVACLQHDAQGEAAATEGSIAINFCLRKKCGFTRLLFL